MDIRVEASAAVADDSKIPHNALSLYGSGAWLKKFHTSGLTVLATAV